MQLSREDVAGWFADAYLARYGGGQSKEGLLASEGFQRDAELWWRLVKGEISWTRLHQLDPVLAEMHSVPHHIVASAPIGAILPERVRVVVAAHPGRGLRIHNMETQEWLEDDSGDNYEGETYDSSQLDTL